MDTQYYISLRNLSQTNYLFIYNSPPQLRSNYVAPPRAHLVQADGNCADQNGGGGGGGKGKGKGGVGLDLEYTYMGHRAWKMCVRESISRNHGLSFYRSV